MPFKHIAGAVREVGHPSFGAGAHLMPSRNGTAASEAASEMASEMASDVAPAAARAESVAADLELRTTFVERKKQYHLLNPKAKIDLVDALRREKEKAERHVADIKAQRERQRAEGLRNKIVVDPSASRPFLDMIARVRTNHAALTKLDFSVGAWWLNGADVITLAEALKQNTTVTELNFHGNSLGVQGAETLAGMLKTNRTLTALNLGGNGITSAGAKSIADSLYFNGGPALRVLQLYSNSITDDGANALGFALGGTKVPQNPAPCTLHPAPKYGLRARRHRGAVHARAVQ